MWDEIYERIVQLVNAHRSTLVFVNTRRLAERIAHQLGERLGEDNVAAHHGSLSRKLRLEAERKLKEGQVKVLVATASLELGIDVGTVDLVCHISSPRSIAVALQRVGRSGHWRGAVPKGRFFVTTRDDLAECAVLVRAIRLGELDRLIFPEGSLDVLAQQIVACCASGSAAVPAAVVGASRPHRSDKQESGATTSEDDSGAANDGWDEDELFAIRKARLSLSQSNAPDVRRSAHDAFGRNRVATRPLWRLPPSRPHQPQSYERGAALVWRQLPAEARFPTMHCSQWSRNQMAANVGTVDEDFAVESMAGDIMLLGNTSWRIRRVESRTSRVLVEDAHGAPPTVPFWRGEAPARTEELSQQLGELRKEISDRLPGVVPVEGWRNLARGG